MKVPADSGNAFDFGQSRLRPIYVMEAFGLADQIVRKSTRLFESYPDPALGPYISMELEGLEIALSMLSDAARLHELFAPMTKKDANLKSRATLRALELSKLVPGIDVANLLPRLVRNSVEHFAERLDALDHDQTGVRASEAWGVGYNLVFSHASELTIDELPYLVLNPPTPIFQAWLVPLRVYVVETKTIYNFADSMRIDILVDAARDICDALVKNSEGGHSLQRYRTMLTRLGKF